MVRDATEALTGDSPAAAVEKPLVVCSLVALPAKYVPTFSYLQGMQLFFFDVVHKPNRVRIRDRRLCFVTDYTINLASPRGHVSRCAKVEDIAEIICDASTHAVGVRMRTRPFAVNPSDQARWNCFHEMPVDTLLYAGSAAQHEALLHVLCYVYHACTQDFLPCRQLRKGEGWDALLVLVPDGSRVKKKAMLYHAVAATTTPGALSSPSTPAITGEEATEHVPAPSAVFSATESGEHVSAGAREKTATPALPRHRPTSAVHHTATLPDSASGAAPTQLATGAADAGPRLPAPPVPVPFAKNLIAPTTSATRRGCNPLTEAALSPSDDNIRAVPTSTTTARSGAGAAPRERPLLRLDSAATAAAAAAEPLSDASSIFTPCSPEQQAASASAATEAGATMQGLAAKVVEQQRYIVELRRSRYSKECELDDLKRYLGSVTSDPRGSRYTSPLWSPPRHTGVSSPRPGVSATRAPSAAVAVGSSHGSRERAQEGQRGDDGQETAQSLSAEAQLQDALERHRELEETVWAYYEDLPEELRGHLRSYQRRGSAAQHTTGHELRYLQRLVERSEQTRSPAWNGAKSDVQSCSSMSAVGGRLDAFVEELHRKETEIDRLRRQVVSSAVGTQ
ncbi:hypothetical protein NESM_000078600 [Novymonas esmeraldas]|uniref:Uncharacterized protein n=1 Tax=Novymonas esmeraldas TaxID=1808958 RepID=A0AAW0F2A2_9TRYP